MENSTEVPLKIKQNYHDPAILLLDIYPKGLKRKSQRDSHTPMFTEIFIIIAKRQ